MSKSIAFACRVVVMLSFLIAIPLIALFGKSLPDVAETVWKYWKKPAQENAWVNAEEAPLFSPAAATPELPDGFPSSQQQVALTSNTDNSTIPAAYLAPSTPSQSMVPSPSPYVPSTVPSNAYPPRGGEQRPFSDPGLVTTESAPAYASQPLVPMQTASPTAVSQAPGASQLPPSSQDGEFQQISQRLQELGATYYRLESWGSGRPLFRFQCRMAIMGSSGLTRQFEATDQDPAQAMRQVLNQIEAWKQTPANNSSELR